MIEKVNSIITSIYFKAFLAALALEAIGGIFYGKKFLLILIVGLLVSVPLVYGFVFIAQAYLFFKERK